MNDTLPGADISASPPLLQSLTPKKANPSKLVRTDSRAQTLDAFVDLSESQPRDSPKPIKTNSVVVYKDKTKQTTLVAGEKRKRYVSNASDSLDL